MIAYWYKTYIRRFGEGAKKKEKKGKVVTTGITALPFFLPFLGFIAKSRIFLILEPFSLPNVFCVFSS
jgi:hypothetical protein